MKRHITSADPVISVDTKKKALIGAFRNTGRTWRKKGHPEAVNVHDLPQQADGKAFTYGAYDVARARAVVSVGISHDTAEFAVESIRRWWHTDGAPRYRTSTRLLICADGGGSNGSRLRAWTLHLQRLANEITIPITVCHYPPGTRKWNKIEHRLFSCIRLSWKGQPLRSYEPMINLIRATRTKSGLSVTATLDQNEYQTGVNVSKAEFTGINIQTPQNPPALELHYRAACSLICSLYCVTATKHHHVWRAATPRARWAVGSRSTASACVVRLSTSKKSLSSPFFPS